MIEVEGQLKLIGTCLHLFVSVDPSLDVLHLLHLLLCTLGVVPKVGSLGAQLLFFQFHLFSVDIKIAVQRLGTLFDILELFARYHLLLLLSC